MGGQEDPLPGGARLVRDDVEDRPAAAPVAEALQQLTVSRTRPSGEDQHPLRGERRRGAQVDGGNLTAKAARHGVVEELVQARNPGARRQALVPDSLGILFQLAEVARSIEHRLPQHQVLHLEAIARGQPPSVAPQRRPTRETRRTSARSPPRGGGPDVPDRPRRRHLVAPASRVPGPEVVEAKDVQPLAAQETGELAEGPVRAHVLLHRWIAEDHRRIARPALLRRVVGPEELLAGLAEEDRLDHRDLGTVSGEPRTAPRPRRTGQLDRHLLQGVEQERSRTQLPARALLDLGHDLQAEQRMAAPGRRSCR